MRKKIIVSVTNDLVTDQRVHKTCSFLQNIGFDVLLVGRYISPHRPKLAKRDYKTHRMRLLFNRGALFYAEFNIRLFLFLLMHKFDILTSNDLDTLTANYLASILKKKPLVYDSHEYFTEVPELTNRPSIQKVWKFIEQQIFPQLKYTFTVSDSIASLFEEKYDVRPLVVRNIPEASLSVKKKTRSELNLPDDKFIIILQGSGININRGAEEAVEAMKYIDNAILLIIGSGDVINELKRLSNKKGIKGKVIFFPPQEYSTLMQYTLNSDIGLSLDKDTNINYKYSLPNKLFDYIKAETPILASNLHEIKKIIIKYNIGDFIPDHSPISIANLINQIINNPSKIKKWKKNLKIASNELTWENETKNIIKVYKHFL